MAPPNGEVRWRRPVDYEIFSSEDSGAWRLQQLAYYDEGLPDCWNAAEENVPRVKLARSVDPSALHRHLAHHISAANE
jgi:hypothetical protein